MANSRTGIGEVARNWGSVPAERILAYPCERYVSDPNDNWFRAIDIDAPAATVFLWLCQLKIAPYSYDLINNWGKYSPRVLTADAENLEVGQRFMKIFDLVEFKRDQHVTLLKEKHRIYGSLGLTYALKPVGKHRCRLVVKAVVKHPSSLVPINGRLGPYMDLMMTRKQLITLKRLAERTSSHP